MPRWPLLCATLVVLLTGCDHGLVPPEEPPRGTLRAVVSYAGHPDAWPPPDSLAELRLFAMRFVPRDTSDLINLTRIVFSDPLPTGVPADTVVLGGIETGVFLYTGVAQKYDPDDLFAWKPVGLYEPDDGIFRIEAGDTTDIAITVDFRDPPPFPPPTSVRHPRSRP